MMVRLLWYLVSCPPHQLKNNQSLVGYHLTKLSGPADASRHFYRWWTKVYVTLLRRRLKQSISRFFVKNTVT